MAVIAGIPAFVRTFSSAPCLALKLPSWLRQLLERMVTLATPVRGSREKWGGAHTRAPHTHMSVVRIERFGQGIQNLEKSAEGRFLSLSCCDDNGLGPAPGRRHRHC